MKKITVLSLLIFFTSLISNAQTGIKFEHDSWGAVIAKAKAENKVIFLDAYTAWCGPCKMLQANVFPDASLGDYFNENFISAKIDMEKGEGLEIAKKYIIRGYPTLLFIDPNSEKVVHKVLGYRGVEELKAVGHVALVRSAATSSR